MNGVQGAVCVLFADLRAVLFDTRFSRFAWEGVGFDGRTLDKRQARRRELRQAGRILPMRDADCLLFASRRLWRTLR